MPEDNSIIENNLAFERVIIKPKKVDYKEFCYYLERKEFKNYWGKFPFAQLILIGHPKIAIDQIFDTFEIIKNIDNEKFHRFHKGNPYYWLGISYFILQNYSLAVYFINAAVKEDLDLDKPNYPSPATWFIELDSKPKEQAGRDIVKIAENEMEKLIDLYRDILNYSGLHSDFSLNELRKKLLTKSTNIETQKHQSISTALISYVLEFNNQIKTLRVLDSVESIEPFAIHLFKGCVLLESILKDNPNVDYENNLSKDLIWWVNLYKNVLGIESLKLNAKDFQDIVNNIPQHELSIDDSFSITCKVRNKIGHFIEWDMEIGEEEYSALYKAIGVSCLHAINCLYE